MCSILWWLLTLHGKGLNLITCNDLGLGLAAEDKVRFCYPFYVRGEATREGIIQEGDDGRKICSPQHFHSVFTIIHPVQDCGIDVSMCQGSPICVVSAGID